MGNLHRKVRNQRAAFRRKVTGQLVNTYGWVVFADLQIRKYHPTIILYFRFSDVGWGQFVQCCVVKAENAKRQGLADNPPVHQPDLYRIVALSARKS